MFETAELRNETLHELGSLYHKQRNFRAARRVLGKYTTCTPKPALTRELCSMLGLSCTAMGDILDGVSWYKKAITLDAGYKEAWLNMFHAYKEGGHVRALQLVQYPALPAKLHVGGACAARTAVARACARCCSALCCVPGKRFLRVQVEEAEKAFNQIVKLDKRDETRSMAAHRFRAHMLQCMGQHAQAADVLTKALLPLNGKTAAGAAHRVLVLARCAHLAISDAVSRQLCRF